jgi:prolyl 4-hydroxylase
MTETVAPPPSSDTASPDLVPERARLVAIGRKVRQRLAATPGLFPIETGGRAEICAVGDFFSAEECAKLIALIDEGAKPSSAFDVPYEAGYRTSYSGDMDPGDPFIQRLQRRLDDFMGLQPEFGETIQGQRYQPGQQFMAHNDWFPPGSRYWQIEAGRGGQRCYTCMVYLNDVEEGGTTDFPLLGLSFQPRAGTMLIWNNADPEGNPNPDTLHAGTPVVRGVKYVITKWYRTRRWR